MIDKIDTWEQRRQQLKQHYVSLGLSKWSADNIATADVRRALREANQVPRPMTIQWFTTAPNPRSPATGFDAGQRGWRLHAVETDHDNFAVVKRLTAMCGLRPAHGWGLDLFIDKKCANCLKIISRRK